MRKPKRKQSCSTWKDRWRIISHSDDINKSVGYRRQTALQRGQFLAKRPISAKSVHLTSLYGAKDISKC